MTILETIRGPHDLKALSGPELGELAADIRKFLIEAVARTGGHLGPNLGVVELSVALHRAFAPGTSCSSRKTTRVTPSRT
ncbi:1-deoxy-D-xylulose-5-phosphate synthase N-terminal domain-containing protein, partial [Micromonospora matsumotoense]|uniref:1-deoxy-D-xylulose-5-phosphate synthase N-terminal domain-containing protein n=1 Tax=Micromonospora matsumotoense TaxID=121616 RepID=UPI003405B38B